MTKHFTVKIFFLFVLFFFHNKITSKAQNLTKMDSLMSVLYNYKSTCNQPCISDSSKVNLLNQISWEYKFKKPDSALYYSKNALEVAEKINWQSGIAQSYHQIASCYNNVGESLLSIDFYLKALDLWEDIERKATKNEVENILTRKSKTLGNLAAVYNKVNFKSEALDCFLKALKIDERFNNKDGIATKLGNIGTFFYHENEFSKALDYLLQSLKMDEKLKNVKRMGANLGNTGLAYWKLGDRSRALEYHLRALEINKQEGNQNYTARDLQNIAVIYDEQKKYPLALEYYSDALRIKSGLGDKSAMAIITGNIGSLYQDRKEFSKAEKYLLKAIEIADSIHELETVRDNLLNLSSLYFQIGDYKRASDNYQKVIVVKDSILSEANTEKFTRMVMNYAFDKKEAATKAEQDKKEAFSISEIQKQKLLRDSIAVGAGIIFVSFIFSFFFYKRKRDAEQKQKETSLSLQVSETEMKALRSQMNPHFIFNALQSIQTFLMSHRSEEANTYLLKFSKLMRLVLENSQHSEVSLKDDMQALELYMQLESIRLPHPFTYEFHIDASIDLENDTIPPLILQPFVENAIWHGLQYKSEPGHINIFISKKDNALYATIEDNGVGRDKSKQVQQPMLIKKESLGMKLTEERLKILNELKKIKAEFKITDLFTKDNRSAGTKVELSLPIAL
jgi:tetratricopeptide (TPR) repeat protein